MKKSLRNFIFLASAAGLLALFFASCSVEWDYNERLPDDAPRWPSEFITYHTTTGGYFRASGELYRLTIIQRTDYRPSMLQFRVARSDSYDTTYDVTRFASFDLVSVDASGKIVIVCRVSRLNSPAVEGQEYVLSTSWTFENGVLEFYIDDLLVLPTEIPVPGIPRNAEWVIVSR